MGEFLAHLDRYLQGSLPLALAAAYLGGLLASLTPCVYPMIPITAGVIGNANLGGTRLRAFFLSLWYVLGMAITYAGLGLFAALTGRFFGAVSTSPYTFLFMGNLLLLFGLVMLEAVPMPLLGLRRRFQARGPLSVFAAGLSAGLVAGPCTAPVLGALLAYVATSGSVARGGLLLLAFSFGMGTLLLAVGAFSGLLAALPRSGAWMVRLKKGIGAGMLLLAEYFLIKAGGLLG